MKKKRIRFKKIKKNKKKRKTITMIGNEQENKTTTYK